MLKIDIETGKSITFLKYALLYIRAYIKIIINSSKWSINIFLKSIYILILNTFILSFITFVILLKY